MSIEAASDFLPSRDGLRFTNAWPHVPTIWLGPGIGVGTGRGIGLGDAADGLCGGMCFTAADLRAVRVAPPEDSAPPPTGSPRYAYVVSRQVASLDWLRLPLRFYAAMVAGPTRRASDMIRRDWPAIRAAIDVGHPAMLGLVRVSSANPSLLTRNHQVLAWAYALDGPRLTVRLYDPNHGPRDDVAIVLRLADGGTSIAELGQTTGEPLVAFFRAPYVPRDPGPWRARPGPGRGTAQA